jgi:SAM-dependent methyltransferase
MTPVSCRACRAADGTIVLDLGEQPASDAFPAVADPGPDPAYPLRMWLCGRCGLAQLAEDGTSPAEPRGVEPVALVEQAADAVSRVAALLPPGGTVAEYGSPHGGSWLPLLTARGLLPVSGGERADVIVDCFGMMHASDQAAALAERLDRLRPGGTLLLQYHSLATIVRSGQWNALRHGHFAYYSTTALATILARAGGVPVSAWRFDLYGGTVLLAVRRTGAPDSSVRDLLAAEAAAGVTDPAVVSVLQEGMAHSSRSLADWLAESVADGRRVLGYGAASRSVALLCQAGVDVELLAGVADASTAKWGRRMPGTRIPIISPAELLAGAPDTVLLFVPDLLAEVRRALPLPGARWVLAEPEPHLALT